MKAKIIKNLDLDLAMSRMLLSEVWKDVKKNFPLMKQSDATIYSYKMGHGTEFEFHGPNGFYWRGRAYCVAEARYKGWVAYLKDKNVKGYENASI